jgi:membrane associated rhomboid family serine protease
MRADIYRGRVTSRPPFKLPFRRAATDAQPAATEPPFDPTSWSGALIVMLAFTAVLWVIQIVNANHDYAFNRFGLKPREVDGLWGVLTQPFLHESYGHLLSNTVPLVGIGWVLMLSGIRVWLFVTATVIVLGGLATWVVGPSNTVIVGASGMVFGWLGYLLARAYFTRRLKWILTAVALLVFFGTLLGSLLPTVNARVSWQSHVCGFLAGIFVGWLLHPRKGSARTRTGRAPVG